LRWSDGVLFEDEFNAFWTTWESQFLADAANGVFILYRVPEEVVEQIAAMEITSPTETEISINRFIIAELPYRTQ
jgi:hypothetical protein